MTERKKPWPRGMGNRKKKKPSDYAADIAREERRAKAWALRAQGLEYRAIGEALGVSHTQASQDIKDYVAEYGRETQDHVREQAGGALRLLQCGLQALQERTMKLRDPVLELARDETPVEGQPPTPRDPHLKLRALAELRKQNGELRQLFGEMRANVVALAELFGAKAAIKIDISPVGVHDAYDDLTKELSGSGAETAH